jgi:hypothetical protein
MPAAIRARVWPVNVESTRRRQGLTQMIVRVPAFLPDFRTDQPRPTVQDAAVLCSRS